MKYNDETTAFPTKKGYFSTFKSKCIKLSYHLKLSHAKTCPSKRFCSGKRDLWIILLSMFRVCLVFLAVHCSLVVICRERADLLALFYMMFYCICVFFSCGVLGQGYGARLYQFLIFALFLTYITTSFKNELLTY